jgi:hypothetical protein
MRAIVAAICGVAGIAFFTLLLKHGLIGETSYVALAVACAVAAMGIYGFPRLAELDLKNLRLTLREVKEATSEAIRATEELEKVKEEVAGMYGGIEHIRKAPFVLDEQKRMELGLSGGFTIPGTAATMRYPAGCIKRERERLARIFINIDQKTPQQLAEAILDGSLDDHVFKWNGPECGLDVPPKSVDQSSKGTESTDG